MDINNNKEWNFTLDSIIKSRCSTRFFKDEAPSKEDIESILNASMYAPYAALAVGDNEYFRRFFVFENGSTSMETVGKLMVKKAEEGLKHLIE